MTRKGECGHEVADGDYLYHIGWGWNTDGLDLCHSCYKAISPGLYIAIMRSIDAGFQKIYAKKDAEIAALQETIELLENDSAADAVLD